MDLDLRLKLKNSLTKKLPGQDAQFSMAPVNRGGRGLPENGKFRPGAVKILLCEDSDGGVFIPLTERAVYDGAHSGQVSLPGGKFDETDPDLAHTAVRECGEEIGVTSIEVLGKLTQLYIPVSGFMVDPFVGWCRDKDPKMVSHEREVQRILKLKIDDLAGDKLIERGIIEVNGYKLEAPWYSLDGARIWGATAMILAEFSAVLRQLS